MGTVRTIDGLISVFNTAEIALSFSPPNEENFTYLIDRITRVLPNNKIKEVTLELLKKNPEGVLFYFDAIAMVTISLMSQNSLLIVVGRGRLSDTSEKIEIVPTLDEEEQNRIRHLRDTIENALTSS